MQNIVFVNRFFYPDISATSQMLTDLVFSLENNIGNLQVITSRQHYDNKTILKNVEVINNVTINRVWTTNFGRAQLLTRTIDYFTFYISTFIRLLTTLKKGDLVIVKTDPPLISIIVFAATKIRGAHYINWLQDLFPEVAIQLGIKSIKPISSFVTHLRNISLKNAITNIAIGKMMAEIIKRIGIPTSKIRIINNWASGSEITPIPKDKNSLITTLNLSNKFVVGYSGNMGRAHDFSTIIEAMRLLKNEPRIHFLFTGDGAKKSDVIEAAKIHNLENLTLTPYQPKEFLSESLNIASVHLVSLLPSLEGLIVPSKIYGIFAAGKPTIFIGSHRGEIAQLLKEHECGLCANTGDAKKVAEYIQILANNPDKISEMSKNARNSFNKYFEKNIAVKLWKNTILNALETRS